MTDLDESSNRSLKELWRILISSDKSLLIIETNIQDECFALNRQLAESINSARSSAATVAWIQLRRFNSYNKLQYTWEHPDRLLTKGQQDILNRYCPRFVKRRKCLAKSSP